MSLWGLQPKTFEVEDTRTGNTLVYHQNETQQALWSHWEKMLDTVHPDCIILNGDIVDGPQKKNIGRTVVSSNILWQCAACEQIVNTLPDVPKYFTLGSEYHSTGEEGIPAEQYVADKVDGVYGDELIIKTCGINIYARHFIGTSNSTWQYRSTPVSKDIMLLSINEAEDRYGPVDLAVFSHAHYFTSVAFPKHIGVITPAWQGKTPFAVKKGIISPPDIGWITVKIDEDDNIYLDRHGLTHIGKPCKVVGSNE